MGIGREVADAYISVHGDLSDFRKDLEKAGPMTEQAAMKNADSFADAWGKRLQSDVNGKWGSIVDAMYSDKKLDWDRLVGKFDTNGNLDEAQAKIDAFMEGMRKSGTLTQEEYVKADAALGGMMDNLRERNRLDEEHREQLKESARFQKAILDGEKLAAQMHKDIIAGAIADDEAYNDRRKKTMEAAIAENERWARTLEGIRKNNSIKSLNEDFRQLAAVMNDADMDKFAKSFDSLEKARGRVYDITAAMQQQGRISSEEAEKIQTHMNAFIDAEKAKSKAMKDALDETNRLKKAQDDYNISLSGMARSSHFSKLENDFRNLAAAMDSNDWSAFERGAKSTGEMRQNIANAASEMHRLGRMTDTEYGLILERTDEIRGSFRDGGNDGKNFFRTLSDGAARFRSVLGTLNNGTRGFREHLQGFAGLNVFGDMVRGGLDFVHNLDRIALGTSKATTLLGTMGSIGGSSLAGLVVIAGDITAALGGLAAVAPAFLIGTAIGMGVLIAAFKDTKTVLADLKPAFAKFQDDISADFWKEAAGPIRDLVKTLLPILDNPKGTSTARSLGKVFASLATSIKDVPAEKFNTMFDRMNGAIDVLSGAMPPLVRAFTTLGMVGSEYFNRAAKSLVGMSEDFDRFIQKSAENGDLNRWIENMITGFRDMGRAIDGTLGIFNAIGDAARRAGSGGLTEFADKLQGIAKAMQAAEFQNTLTMLFSGMNIAVGLIGDAIAKLGPAIRDVMPSIKLALVDIGTVAAGIIGFLGEILSNPLVQKGITDFSSGMVAAIEKLKPAIQPFADSLGTMMTLLGQIIGSVAQIAATFLVELSPVLDRMGTKLGALVQPLADGASNFLKDMKGPLEAIEKNFIDPLIKALDEKLIPLLTGPGGFSEELGKFLKTVADAAGPSFTTLVNDVLPALLKIATEVLEPLGKLFALFTPLLNTLLKDTAKGLEGVAAGIKALKGQGPIEDAFPKFKPEAAQNGIDKMTEWNEKMLKGQISWGDIFEAFVSGDPSGAITAGFVKLGVRIGEALSTSGDWLWNDIIVKGVTMIFEGRMFGDEVKKNLEDFWRDDESIRQDVENSIKDWWREHIEKPLNKAGEDIGKLWDDTIGKFWDSIFGGEKPLSGGGGGGAGGRGMGVTGKLDPKMLGLPDEDGTRSWFEEFGTWLSDGFHGALNRLGEVFGIADFGTKWDEFWGGLPTKVQEAWDAVVLWVQTKAAEVKLSWDSFIADAKLNWDTFWTNLPTNVSNAWAAVVLWVQTKAAEVKLNWDSFIADAKLNWENFWNNLPTVVSNAWAAVVLWVQTKAAEVKLNWDNFIADAKRNWDNFWNNLPNVVSAAWNAVVNWVRTKAGEVRANFENFISTVRSNWDNFWNGLPGAVQRGWDSIVNGIRTGVDNAVRWVQTLPEQIRTSLGNINLSGAGAAIIQGFANGLKSTWGSVTDFVGGIANWIAQNKGPISYDRTLLVPAGEAIMAGLESSMKDKFGNVMDFVSTMADTMAAAFAHSKMYIAGANAALGLADGLADNKDLVFSALGDLTPASELSAKITGGGWGVGTPTPAAGRIITVEAGAIQYNSPVTDPGLAASKTLDGLVNLIS